MPGLGEAAKLLLTLDLRGLQPNTARDDSATMALPPHTAVVHVNTSAGPHERRDVYVTATVLPGRTDASRSRAVLPLAAAAGSSSPSSPSSPSPPSSPSASGGARAGEPWELSVLSRDALSYANEAMEDNDQFAVEWHCEEIPPQPEAGPNATTPNPCFVPSSPSWGSGAAFTNFNLATLRHAAVVTVPSMGWPVRS